MPLEKRINSSGDRHASSFIYNLSETSSISNNKNLADSEAKPNYKLYKFENSKRQPFNRNNNSYITYYFNNNHNSDDKYSFFKNLKVHFKSLANKLVNRANSSSVNLNLSDKVTLFVILLLILMAFYAVLNIGAFNLYGSSFALTSFSIERFNDNSVPPSEYEANEQPTCIGSWSQQQTCSQMNKKHGMQIVGTLCMDLCITNAIKLPDCSYNYDLFYYASEEDKKERLSYQFFLLNEHDSTYIIPQPFNLPFANLIEKNLSMDQFRLKLYNFIESNLNESSLIEKTIERLIYFVDVNKDEKINFAEASTLWSLMNMKHTYYLLILAGKAYIPEIKSFCGHIIETEQIKLLVATTMKKKPDVTKGFFHNALFNLEPKVKLKWDYRCKISIGIMEFFMDLLTFNPNDEFGPSSLYLCSSIESSFGFNFYNEAKLVKYDQLMSGKDLQQKLDQITCKSDLDCRYSNECLSKCDLSTQKCTHLLQKPQITNYCLFLRDYLMDNQNVTKQLQGLINRCLNLTNLYVNDPKILFEKNKMPIEFSRHKSYMMMTNYWESSLEFTQVTNDLMNTLYSWVKFKKDPVKKAKKKT